MNHKKLFGYLFLLPLILAIWGSWQLIRTHQNPWNPEQEIVKIQATITEMEAIHKQDPMRMLKFEGMQYSMVPQVAIGYLQRNLKDLKTQALLRKTQKLLPLIALASAFTALFTAALAVIKVRGASHSAMKSRDHLLRAFTTTRYLLPLISTGITLAIALSLASLVIYEGIAIWNADLNDNARMRLMLICAIVALASIWLIIKSLLSMPGAFKMFKPDPGILHGQALSKAAAPGLWLWVEQLSKQLDTPAPDHIVVGINESFFVSSHPYQLKPSDTLLAGKILHLPLAEMSLLNKAETSAIIGHELGHFCGEDTAYSKRFIPIYAGVERSLDAILKTQKGRDGIDYMLRPAWLLGCWVLDKFHEAVMHWSRIREFAADQVGVKIAGQEASCSALVRIVSASKPVNETMRVLRNAPDKIEGNFLKSLRKQAFKNGFDEPENHLDQVIAHPFDSHPPTRERLAQMGVTLPLKEELLAHALRRETPESEIWLEPMFQDLNGVVQTLTGELDHVIQHEESEIEKFLETTAAVQSGTRLFYESTWLNVLLLGSFGLLCVIGGAALPFLQKTAAPNKALMLAAGIILFGLLLLWIASIYVKRSKQPVLELSADGLKVPTVTPLIAWKDVRDVDFNRSGQFIFTCFYLDPDRSFEILKDRTRRVVYKKKANTLKIGAGKIKGIKAKDYPDLIVNYLRAGQARAIQKERAEEKQAVRDSLS